MLMKVFSLATARSPHMNVLLVPSVTSTIRVLRLAKPESCSMSRHMTMGLPAG